MTTFADHSAVATKLNRVYSTTGTAPSVMLYPQDSDAKQQWSSLIDELLRWRSMGSELFDPEDRPDPAVIGTALDLCRRGQALQRPPSSAVPTGDGRIALSWHSARDGETVVRTLEILNRDTAEYTVFRNGKVVGTARGEVAAIL